MDHIKHQIMHSLIIIKIKIKHSLEKPNSKLRSDQKKKKNQKKDIV